MCHGVNASRGEDARALDTDRICKGRVNCRPRDQPRQGHWIAAHIQDPAAAKRRIIKPRAGVETRIETKAGFNMNGCSYFSVSDDFQHPVDLRMAAVHIGFHEKAAFLGGHFCYGNHFGSVHARWLFAEHMLARAQGGDRQFGMPGVRGRDIDGVNLRIAEQILRRRVTRRRRDHVAIAKAGTAGRLARRDGDKRAMRGLRQTIRKVMGDRPRSDNPPANGHDALPSLQ